MSKQGISFVLHSAPAVENSILWGPSVFSYLVNSEDSNGSYSLIHGHLIKGSEPPLHTHTREEEAFYILEGEIDFQVEGEEFRASPGDMISLPRDRSHKFSLVSEEAKVLLFIMPGDFSGFFKEGGSPAKSLEPGVAKQGPPPPAVLEKLAALSKNYGIIHPR